MLCAAGTNLWTVLLCFHFIFIQSKCKQQKYSFISKLCTKFGEKNFDEDLAQNSVIRTATYANIKTTTNFGVVRFFSYSGLFLFVFVCVLSCFFCLIDYDLFRCFAAIFCRLICLSQFGLWIHLGSRWAKRGWSGIIFVFDWIFLLAGSFAFRAWVCAFYVIVNEKKKLLSVTKVHWSTAQWKRKENSKRKRYLRRESATSQPL